ncbi:MAG: Uma2 family endonuclease [Thermomicrobiales bacterium]
MVATRLETIAEFEARNREGLWELIDGEPTAVNPAAGSSSFIGSRIAHYLNIYVDEHPIGYVFGADIGFVLFPDRATVRSPDAAFVSISRLQEIPDTFIPLPPDLAVEVLSPTDRRSDARAKAAMYLDAGVPLVWLIDPRNRTATIYQQDAAPVTIGTEDSLDGGDILPGFSLPLSKFLK